MVEHFIKGIFYKNFEERNLGKLTEKPDLLISI